MSISIQTESDSARLVCHDFLHNLSLAHTNLHLDKYECASTFLEETRMSPCLFYGTTARFEPKLGTPCPVKEGLGRVGFRTKGPEDETWFFDTFTYNGQDINRNDLCRFWAITVDIVFFLEWIIYSGVSEGLDLSYLRKLVLLYQGTTKEGILMQATLTESDDPVWDLYEALDKLAKCMAQAMHELYKMEVDNQLPVIKASQRVGSLFPAARNYREAIINQEPFKTLNHPPAGASARVQPTLLHLHMNEYIEGVDESFAWGSFPSQQWGLNEVKDDVDMKPLHRSGAIRGRSGNRGARGLEKGRTCVV
ncbi:hypothetical protein IAR50_006851 [Cryptococcus sp. DSM 104548]